MRFGCRPALCWPTRRPKKAVNHESGLVISFASFLTWFWLLRRYLASRLGVLSFMSPMFWVILGVWLLGEPLVASFVVGSALVLAGIGLVSGHATLALRWGSWRAVRSWPGSIDSAACRAKVNAAAAPPSP